MAAMIVGTMLIGAAMNTSIAAEITVVSPDAMRAVIPETTAKFEKVSGHKLMVTVVETGEIVKRVLAGQSYDVIIVPSDAADELGEGGQDCAEQRRGADSPQPRTCGDFERPASRRKHAGRIEADLSCGPDRDHQ